MTKLIAIDPGLRKCGVARFDKLHRLIDARTIRIPTFARDLRGARAWIEMAKSALKDCGGPQTLVIESMQVDNRTGNKVSDLLEVQGVAGVIVGLATAAGMNVFGYTPRQWKGSVSKSIMKRRLLDSDLLIEEKNAIHGRATHDAFDAIGIGLYHLNNLREK